MSQVKVKKLCFEQFGGKIGFTVMTFDNSKYHHFEQILIPLELSRYQCSTVFTPSIKDKKSKKKAYIDNDT